MLEAIWTPALGHQIVGIKFVEVLISCYGQRMKSFINYSLLIKIFTLGREGDTFFKDNLFFICLQCTSSPQVLLVH